MSNAQEINPGCSEETPFCLETNRKFERQE